MLTASKLHNRHAYKKSLHYYDLNLALLFLNRKPFSRWRVRQFKTTITSKKLAEIVFHTKYFNNFASILIAVMGCKS